MKIWLRLVIGMITVMFSLGLELYSYPWHVFYGNFTYGVEVTILSYLLPSALAGITVTIAAGSRSRFQGISASGLSVLTGGALLATFLILDVLLGPIGVEVYRLRVRGIFFAEWNFINFFAYVALPLSALVTGMMWLAVRQHRRSRSLPLWL